MRDATIAALAVGTAVLAGVEAASPFLAVLHTWWCALAVSVAGAYLLIAALPPAFGRPGSRPLALVALGGSLLAACFAVAAFVVGQPERVPAVPGQTYRPSRASGVALGFPAPAVPDVGNGKGTSSAQTSAWPNSVSMRTPAGTREARAGEVVRTGAYVFRVDSGPAAYVDARDGRGKPVTVTQPDGAAFLSPWLTFTGRDGDQPEDYFAVPALHRTVQVDYWSGLPSRGIDVPFLVLRIAEENGGALYEGVAVSGRPLGKAGMSLTFFLGTYPIVTESGAPPLVMLWAGVAMIAFGLAFILAQSFRGRKSGVKGPQTQSSACL